VHHQGILRLKQPGGRLDYMKIPHPVPGSQHCRVGIRPELEVRPQGAAEEGKAPDLDGLIFQQTDITPFNSGSELLEHSRNRMTVELVVAYDINDGLLREVLFHPLDAFATHMDVARQNHHVRACLLRRVIAKFQMKIAQDLQSHQYSFPHFDSD